MGYEGGKLLDMRIMVSMCKVYFCLCHNVVALNGLPSKLTNLQELYIIECKELHTSLVWVTYLHWKNFLSSVVKT